jgi:hypothetical protein
VCARVHSLTERNIELAVVAGLPYYIVDPAIFEIDNIVALFEVKLYALC